MTTEEAPPPSGSAWFYVFRGQRQGPVDEAAMAAHIAGGQVRADTLVWTEGMAEWVAAGTVPRWTAEFGAAASAGLSGAPPVAPGPIMVSRSAFVPTGYAGFWLRLVAYILDTIILSVGYVALTVVLSVPMGIIGGSMSGSGPQSGAATSVVLLFTCAMYVLPLLGMWSYFALFESSRHQATPGKMAMGLRVTTMEGQRINLGRATGRFAGRILSGMILCVGYIMIAFTEKKQGLHDMIAGTLVVTGRT